MRPTNFGGVHIAVSILLQSPIILTKNEACKDDSFVSPGTRLKVLYVLMGIRRIPNNQKYEQIVLDTAIARMLAGELDIPATMKTIEDGWNEVTDEVGRDSQLNAYKSTIGAK